MYSVLYFKHIFLYEYVLSSIFIHINLALKLLEIQHCPLSVCVS